MAKIPTYNGRQVESRPLGAPQFSGTGPDASGLVRGLAQAEAGVIRLIEKSREESESAQTKEAALIYDQFEQDLKYNPETGLYNRRGKGAQDITNQGFSALDKKFAEITAGIKNERVRRRFTDYRNGRRESFGREFNRYEFEQNEVYKDQVDDGLLETAMQGAALAYKDARKVGEYQTMIQGLVRSKAQRKGLPDEQTQVQVLKTNSALVSNVIERLAIDNPQQAKQYFESQLGGMTADDQVKVSRVIERQIKDREIEARQMQAIRRTELSSRVADATAAYMSGYEFARPLAVSEFVAAYGAEEGRARYQEFQKVPELGDAIRELAKASPEERTAILQRFNPAQGGVAGEGFQADSKAFSALLSASSRFDKEMQNDPAAYVAQRSAIVRKSAEGLASGDPAATAAYVTATIAEQQRLGIQKPKLLTEWQAAAIASRFTEVEDGGNKSADLIEGLRHQWGNSWPAVYEQLQGKLPPAALVIASGVDPKTAATLSRIASLKTEELKKGLDSTSTRDAKDALNSKLADFRVTLNGQVGGERTFNTLHSELERLTYAYMGQGQSPKDAAEQAYDAVVGAKYTIEDTYRVPSTLDAGLVKIGARAALRKLDTTDIDNSTYKWADDEFIADRLSEVPHQSYWVTLPDESGLALYLEGEAVLNKAQQPITRSFESLIELATERLGSMEEAFPEGRMLEYGKTRSAR